MADIINFDLRRKESIAKKKRQFERIFFDEIIGCYSVIEEGSKIFPIDIVDISESGCKISIPENAAGVKNFEIDSEISLRLYFTKKSFVTLVAKVRRSEVDLNKDGKKTLEIGAEFDQSLPGHEVLRSFVQFISSFAEYSKVDNNTKKVYFL